MDDTATTTTNNENTKVSESIHFLKQVLGTEDTNAGAKEVEKYLHAIETKIHDVQKQAYQTIQSSKGSTAAFLTKMKNMKQANNTLEEMQAQLNTLTNSVQEKQSGVFSKLLDTTIEYQQAVHQMNYEKKVSEVLKVIQKVANLLSDMNDNIESGQYIKATDLSVAVDDAMSDLKKMFEQGDKPKIFLELQEMQSLNMKRINKRIDELWSNGLHVTNLHIKVNKQIVSPRKASITVSLEDIIYCLKFLGIFSEKLSQLAQQLQLHIFQPLLGVNHSKSTTTATATTRTTRSKAASQQQQQQDNNTVQYKSVVVHSDNNNNNKIHELTLSTEAPATPVAEVKENEKQTKQTNSRRKKGSKGAATQSTTSTTATAAPQELESGSVYSIIVDILTFFRDKVFDSSSSSSSASSSTSSSSTLRLLGQSLWPSLSELLTNHYLKKNIPEESHMLNTYTQQLLNYTQLFEMKLQQIGFIDADEQVLSSIVKNVDYHFAEKRRLQVLAQARSLMLSEQYNTVKIPSRKFAENSSGTQQPSTKTNEQMLMEFPFDFPACSISESAQQLIELGRTTLLEATQGSTLCGHRLFATVRDIFDLFRTIVPTVYTPKMEGIPGISMIFHNDCMYIAHNLMTLTLGFRAKLPAPLNSTATLVDMAPFFRSLAEREFGQQLQKQEQQLMDTMNSCNGFGDTINPQRLAHVQRHVNVLLHHLSLVSKIWMDILPFGLYCHAIAFLVEKVCNRIITEVEKLKDIAEQETHHLSNLMLQFHKAKEWFIFHDELQDENKKKKQVEKQKELSDLEMQSFVPCWLKFNKVKDMLTISLAEISNNVDNGIYTADFTASELSKLVQSLFSETANRTKLLQKIQNKLPNSKQSQQK